MSEDTNTAPSPLDITRNGTYSFPEHGKPSPNYLRRVKPVGGNFVTGVNEVVAIEAGDILLKLPGKTPWFAQFRDVQEAEEPTGEPSVPAASQPQPEAPAEAPAEASAEAKPEETPEAKPEETPAKSGKGKK